MSGLIKTLLGVSIFSLASLASAVDSGRHQSSYDIDDGPLGDGEGTWAVVTNPRTGNIEITINDNGTQTTTLTGIIVKSFVNLSYTAATDTWFGTSTPIRCTRAGGIFNGCNFIHLDTPVEVYGIVVDLDSNNLGTITQKSYNTHAGVTARTTVTYALTAE